MQDGLDEQAPFGFAGDDRRTALSALQEPVAAVEMKVSLELPGLLDVTRVAALDEDGADLLLEELDAFGIRTLLDRRSEAKPANARQNKNQVDFLSTRTTLPPRSSPIVSEKIHRRHDFAGGYPKPSAAAAGTNGFPAKALLIASRIATPFFRAVEM
jgi:hypothetical protein